LGDGEEHTDAFCKRKHVCLSFKHASKKQLKGQNDDVMWY